MTHENELSTPDVTRPDPVTNTQTITVKIPGGTNPEATRALFINALWGLRDLGVIEEEYK